MTLPALVATLTEPPAAADGALPELPQELGYLEVRADLTGEVDPEALRRRFGGGLVYTLRSRAEGGRFEGGEAERRQRLTAAAAAGYDLVDLEAERDATPEILEGVPRERRLVSWHGPPERLPELVERFERLAATPARVYKLVPEARKEGEAPAPLLLLRQLGRSDVVAFASGEVGAWTRPLAPRLGSPLVYGSLGDAPGAPGQPSVAKLAYDFDLPQLPPVERLFGIAGRPVAHSRSPRLHNGAYRTLGLEALYLPFHVESWSDFWLDVVESGVFEDLGLPLAGLSVTSPYKEVALAVAGASSPRAQHIDAANTLVRSDGAWVAETTDPEGVTGAVAAAGIEVRGRRAAVVGCGGAGKAAAYGLELAGARVTLSNRGPERGEKAAADLDLPYVPLAELDPGAFDLLVNATPLGRGEGDPLPFELERLAPAAAVIDLVYGDRPTHLVRAAEARGLPVVSGLAVLLYQALGQFRLMTGRELAEPLARRILGLGEGG